MKKMYNLTRFAAQWRKLALAASLTVAGLTGAQAQCTPPTISTFPYTENFDGVATGTLPCGVTVLNVNGDAETWQNRSTVPTQAGQTPVSSTAPNAMVYFYNEDGSTAANDWFFLPAVAMRAGYQYQLSFKYRNSGANYLESLEVKYGTAATVAGQTTTIWQNSSIGTPTFATANASLITPAANGTYYIGFHVNSPADRFFLAIDDVQITETVAPACPAPTNLVVSSVTATSASVSFSGPANSTGYSVIYGPTGFNPATGGTTVTSTTSPVALTGLSGATTYQVYVRANCGATAGQSTLTGPVSFTTACVVGIVSTYPYSENFDNVAAGTLPCGVTVLNANNDASTWTVVTGSTTPGSAPNAMRYTYSAANAANDWFFTPALLFRVGYRYQLTFKYRAQAAAFPEGLEVKYGSAATAAGQTTTLFTNTNIVNTTYATTTAGSAAGQVLSITPTANGTGYIGFHAISAADEYYLFVDDVVVTETLVTATQSAELSKALSVYPNPSNGQFTLDVAGTASKAATLQLQVSNALGQIVHEGSVKNAASNKLDLSKLKAGIYNLRLQDGDQFTVRRIVIE